MASYCIYSHNFEKIEKKKEGRKKSALTISKYLCDLKKLLNYADGREVDKELMIAYKEKLLKPDDYKVSSIHSFLVAANCFFEFMGWYEVKVKVNNYINNMKGICREHMPFSFG